MEEEILTGGRVTAQVVRKGELVHRTPCANAIAAACSNGTPISSMQRAYGFCRTISCAAPIIMLPFWMGKMQLFPVSRLRRWP